MSILDTITAAPPITEGKHTATISWELRTDVKSKQFVQLSFKFPDGHSFRQAYYPKTDQYYLGTIDELTAQVRTQYYPDDTITAQQALDHISGETDVWVYYRKGTNNNRIYRNISFKEYTPQDESDIVEPDVTDTTDTAETKAKFKLNPFK